MIDVYFACKYYQKTMALEQVRLTVSPGEIVGLFGENGSGKTTLLKAMAGLIRLTYGSVRVDGLDPRFHNSISYCSDKGTYFPQMTAMEHRDFLSAMEPSFDSKRFSQLIDYFQLTPGLPVKTFSAGQQAKLELCCCLSIKADWYLIDEPFLGKDFLARRDFIKLMSGLLPETAGVVMATHLAGEIEPLISRAVVMQKGRIIADQPVDALQDTGEKLVPFLHRTCGYDESGALALLQKIWE
ncbi:MAG: ABC transporter ATP-binding protein [Bacillota bacterium]|nr:ABC transporter ATP-binding protein [Bacillota bacterium]